MKWHRAATINAVMAVSLDLNKTAEEHHNTWLNEKLSEGWRLGHVEDIHLKIHPYLVEYQDLPADKKTENAIFMSVVMQVLDLEWAVATD